LTSPVRSTRGYSKEISLKVKKLPESRKRIRKIGKEERMGSKLESLDSKHELHINTQEDESPNQPIRRLNQYFLQDTSNQPFTFWSIPIYPCFQRYKENRKELSVKPIHYFPLPSSLKKTQEEISLFFAAAATTAEKCLPKRN